MLALGTSLHALAVTAAAGVQPVHGEHVRDTIAATLGVRGDLRLRLELGARGHGWVVICPHANASYKEWPDARWAQVREAFPEARVATARQRPFLGQHHAQLGLEELAQLLAGASLVVAVDSGPIHLADALGVPVLGLYAATSALTYGPYSQRNRCIDKHHEASDAQGLSYDSARHLQAGDAMHRIGVDEVIQRMRDDA